MFSTQTDRDPGNSMGMKSWSVLAFKKKHWRIKMTKHFILDKFCQLALIAPQLALNLFRGMFGSSELQCSADGRRFELHVKRLDVSFIC